MMITFIPMILSYCNFKSLQTGTFIVQHDIEQCPRCLHVKQVHQHVLEFQTSGCILNSLEQNDHCFDSLEDTVFNLFKIGTNFFNYPIFFLID